MCFLLTENKIVTAGGGGVIVTNNIEFGERGKYLTIDCKSTHAYEYVHDELGYT